MIRRTPQQLLKQTRSSDRDGLTLLEIILSLSIFFGALAILSQLAWNGARAGAPEDAGDHSL
jgi:type II secretory pathway component PulJ